MSSPEKEKPEKEPGFHDGDGGASWRLMPWDYDDDAIGVTEEKDKPVCVIFDFPRLSGYCFSIEDARKLALALMAAAECAETGEFPTGPGGEA